MAMQTFFSWAFVPCPAADGKHLHPPPPSLQFNLLHKGNNINLSAPPTLIHPPPPRSLFVHECVYYILYGKSFRNVEEVGVSSSSRTFNRAGWRGTGERGGRGSCSSLPPTQVVRPSFIWRQSSGSLSLPSVQLLVPPPPCLNEHPPKLLLHFHPSTLLHFEPWCGPHSVCAV